MFCYTVRTDVVMEVCTKESKLKDTLDLDVSHLSLIPGAAANQRPPERRAVITSAEQAAVGRNKERRPSLSLRRLLSPDRPASVDTLLRKVTRARRILRNSIKHFVVSARFRLLTGRHARMNGADHVSRQFRVRVTSRRETHKTSRLSWSFKKNPKTVQPVESRESRRGISEDRCRRKEPSSGRWSLESDSPSGTQRGVVPPWAEKSPAASFYQGPTVLLLCP
ncbi:hypothetical protein F2P81_017397 [Scophthalmus maximus]|uniref:Uncharacterized protein n=1 Tax=Scophthalmus maximus TaxID=52904 RepID=A0A6A4S637_SCOMX|nr:hypothetical protein F2P81_017397 [Scophthalmus maximus]